MNSRIVLLSFIALVFLVIYLFWPLSSNEYLIQWDKNQIHQKTAFLSDSSLKSDTTERPNILVIIVDDLGKTDISLYGTGKVETPNIDMLGASGVIFDQAYVTSSVCSPSRAAILTGRYPQRFGFTYQMHEFYLENRLQYYGYKYLVNSYPWMPRELESAPSEMMAEKQGLPPSEITLPEMLKRENYKTALIGKWHLGVHNENNPCNFGFDYQYGFYASHSLYALENTQGIVSQRIDNDFSDSFIWEGQRNGAHAIYRNCIQVEEKEYLTNAITRECKDFISTNKDQNFFLIASYNAPHTPLQAPIEYIDQFIEIEDPVKRTYYAMIASLDNAIGDLMKHLEDLKIKRNTLIFFISDNGGATYTHTTDNYPLKGGKITDFEGGVNVPFIISWKDRIPQGIHYNHPVSSMDIFGTITSTLDIPLPETRQLDGVNLIPYITKIDSCSMPHEYLYWYRGSTRAIRSKNWKMIWNVDFNETSLFNMEVNNLEKLNVRIDNDSIENQLKEQYKNWSMNLPEPLWPPLVRFVYEDNGKLYHFDN